MKKTNESNTMLLIILILLGILAFLSGMLFESIKGDSIPKSEIGKTFVSLNVEHCAKTYNHECWIYNEEWDEFNENNNWIGRRDYDGVKLIYR